MDNNSQKGLKKAVNEALREIRQESCYRLSEDFRKYYGLKMVARRGVGGAVELLGQVENGYSALVVAATWRKSSPRSEASPGSYERFFLSMGSDIHVDPDGSFDLPPEFARLLENRREVSFFEIPGGVRLEAK